MNYDTSNEMFCLAADLVNQSSRNIFLTGKAGTGKTTFLKYIKENCYKQLAVVAPTGVAAINAGGVTMHSFFQLPLSPFIPIAAEGKKFSEKNNEVVNRHSLISRLRINNEKKKVLQQLELLIIDEISMVRCDVLDAMDTVLRHVRQRPKDRFGGVQVLFIGDMFQLPPVIREQEWKLLSDYYNSPYFFDSQVIKEFPPVYIEFNKIYRQSDERFIKVLNQVRNNELSEEGMQILDSRFNSTFRREKQEGYIILTTHNDKARDINSIELQKLNSKLFSFKAEITGEFYDNAYPADEILQLKEGAQVMFIKNDTEKIKRYFNGKIGMITKVEEDKIFVQCQQQADKDEPVGIEVKKEKWENIRYTLNKTTRLLEEEVLGSFMQYPLRLAWAITIHKSQGLTFEKAIIDAGEAFAPGQVYVALSRCTNLAGMVLQSRVRPNGLFTDSRILQFSQNSASSNKLQEELALSRKNYQMEMINSTFDFTIATNHGIELLKYLSEHTSSFNPETYLWTEELSRTINKLQATASKFHLQVRTLFQQPDLPEQNTLLQERLRAAESYFTKELETLLQTIKQSPAVTDSRIHAKEYNESLKEIFGQLALKRFLLEGINGGFDIESLHHRKRSFILPLFTSNSYAGNNQQRSESPHPALHQQLRKLRDSICSKKDLPVYFVAGSRTIDEMAEYLPLTLEELEKISGFGKIKIEAYGQQFMEVIQQYCKNNNLSSRIQEKSPKRQRKEPIGIKTTKSDTRAETYKLYKEGMSVADIAKARNLTIQTIEGHLAHYVYSGGIKIEELVSREKLLLIEPAIKDFTGGSITPIKEKLGSTASFGEIKLVIAWADFKKNIQQQ
ncbi:MAG: helix-turn-helix domain-containing protein [Bacteroidota bacterium]